MLSSPTACQVYERLTAAFDEGWSQTSVLHGDREVTIDLGGVVGRLRCSSSPLHDKVVAPLAHLRVDLPPQQPSFSIDWIDATGLDPALTAMPWPPQRTSPAQGTSEVAEDPLLFTAHGDAVLTALHTGHRRTLAAVGHPAAWPPDHYHQSIFITLYQHARLHGLHLIHAAAIGIDGRVILLTGASGSGKTTTMLSCIRQGFAFYSDDATLLRQTSAGALEAVSVLGTINATPQTLAWFPELEPSAAPMVNRTGKRLAMVEAAFPGQAARRGKVVAIMVPEITGQPGTSLAPISRGEVLSAVLPFSLDLHDPTAAEQQLDFLVRAVETVPSYRLRLGSDLSEVPRFLAHCLARQ